MSVSQPSFHSLKSLLHLQDVSVYHHKVALLKQLNLTVKEGSFHCLVGESGSGKSLLARTALNMLQPELHYTGQVDINLEDTDAMFQDTNSNFFQNVRIQNISMPCLTRYILNYQDKNSITLLNANLIILVSKQLEIT